MREYLVPILISIIILILAKKVRMRGAKYLSKVEIQEIIDKKLGKLIDVREYAETNSTGFVPGAIVIPLSTFKETINRLDKGSKYVLMCASGARAQSAYFIMKKSGFVDVSLAKDGFSQWK